MNEIHDHPPARELDPRKNLFIREAGPLLDKNKTDWLAVAQSVLAYVDPDPAARADRLRRAEAVVAGLPLTHTIDLPELAQVAAHGELRCNVAVEAGMPPLSQNTYDFDREKQLDEFVYLRFGFGLFRPHRADGIVGLEFSREVLKGDTAFVSFEDYAFAREAQQLHGIPDAWAMYLRENFRGRDFAEVAAHFIAADYWSPEEYADHTQAPSMLRMARAVPPGIHLIKRQPNFEAKIYGQVSLAQVKRVICNTKNAATVSALRSYGFADSLFSHEDFLV